MSLTDPAPQLPQSDEIWQIARFPLPLWIEPDGDGPPFRPWCVVGLRPPDQFFVQDSDEKDVQPPADQVVEAVVEAARQAGLLPRRLLIAEHNLAEDLRRCLAESGLEDIEVERVESLPQLEEALDSRVQSFFQDDPGLLTGEGVTLDHIASFADAAASFARAEPWRSLVELDRIRIESPEAGRVSLAIVLGSVDKEHGVVFLPDDQETGSEGTWLMICMPAWDIPVHDLYIWERHGLALAHEDRYPAISSPDAPERRPDAGLLAWIEAVLRAIAVSTEDEMDSGRWEKTVETGRGPMRLVLSLPDLLRQAAESPGPKISETQESPKTPEITAQGLAEQAFEAIGRRRVALARQALAIWPDCVDALLLLAGREPDPESSVAMYSRAVEVAGRAFDPLLFETRAGDFWEIPEARPYLQARFGLAEALWDADRWDEAVAHLEELLRLDDLDRLGARRHLVDRLLLLDRDREAVRLLDACPDEILAHSLYTRTLLAFRREGDSPGARNCLTLALSRNRFVPEYLLTDELPPLPETPLFQPGDRSEAFLYGVSSCEVWDGTPGALDWLQDRLVKRHKRGKPGKKKKRRR